MKNHSKKSGFTLIELLVVMTIIVLISVVGILNFREASKSARDGKRKTDLETVRQALVLYKSQVGSYITSNSYSGAGSVTATLTNAATKYLSNPIPVDPTNASPYVYTYTGNASAGTFCLCAQVENSSNANYGAGCTAGSTHYCVIQP